MRLEAAFRGRRVFVTGHTGFKGSWLALWLQKLGAEVTGYALEAPSRSLYARLELDQSCRSVIGDIRDRERLLNAIEEARPELVFHLAAQPLVLPSYDDPLGTVTTNVVGTANVLDVVRSTAPSCAVVVVTSDKCYENRGWVYGYRETDALGGHDLYSASKAAAEIVSAGYRRSFAMHIATARAGNVIGGGDWADGRIVPDCIRALHDGEAIQVRNPSYVRPWQHVLESLRGYLLLAMRLAEGQTEFCDAWNFAPDAADARTVQELVESVIRHWGSGRWAAAGRPQGAEQPTLRIAADKARAALRWTPRWSFETAVAETVSWYRLEAGPATADDLRAFSLAQIERYCA